MLKKILKYFKVVTSRVDESAIKAKTPEAFAVKAALAKALDVASRQKNAIVIGADTIVVLKQKILGKPKNKAAAFKMLKALSGQTHKVITGLAAIKSSEGKIVTGFEVTKVKVKKVPDQVIRAYIKTGHPLDKAGAYGIQEIEEDFGITIEGDYDNVVGLPLRLLKQFLFKLQ